MFSSGGEDSTSTAGSSGSERTGRRRADRRRPAARVEAVAPVDGARSRNPGARHRAAQGRPGANGPRQCEHRRAAEGEPGTNGPHHCLRGQGFRGQGSEPAAQHISGSATADCHTDTQAGADALTIPGVDYPPRWPSRPPSSAPNAWFGPR